MFIHGIIGRHEKMFWPQSRLSTRSSADTKKNVLTAIAFIDTIISRYEKNVLTAIAFIDAIIGRYEKMPDRNRFIDAIVGR